MISKKDSMDIFSGNRRLEELVMFGIDWATFVRHDLDGMIAPFMYLQNGKDQYVRKLITDGDPVEFAKQILQNEEKPYEQFIIGFEGFLRDDNNNRVDAVIIQGFDVTQDKGAALGQMFLPKEKGGFKKIGKVTFLGNPDLIVDKKVNPAADYSVEEIGFTAIATEKDDLTSYTAVFSHEQPAVIANSVKHFLRSKFTGEKSGELSGHFDLNVPNGRVRHEEFLIFVITNAINETLASDAANNWQRSTGRQISITFKNGDKVLYQNSTAPGEIPRLGTAPSADGEYTKLTAAQLNDEFNKIASVPNARTNVDALTKMSALMKEYQRRGLALPSGSKPAGTGSPLRSIAIKLLIGLALLYFGWKLADKGMSSPPAESLAEYQALCNNSVQTTGSLDSTYAQSTLKVVKGSRRYETEYV
jgi:hypothetical protein